MRLIPVTFVPVSLPLIPVPATFVTEAGKPCAGDKTGNKANRKNMINETTGAGKKRKKAPATGCPVPPALQFRNSEEAPCPKKRENAFRCTDPATDIVLFMRDNMILER
ncbi:MAG: hypothetical protein LBR26_02320 [Prevotella sp.]|jgi:hypothetical protein|nr:hypothetical protein [Prevotella sp.]